MALITFLAPYFGVIKEVLDWINFLSFFQICIQLLSERKKSCLYNGSWTFSSQWEYYDSVSLVPRTIIVRNYLNGLVVDHFSSSKFFFTLPSITQSWKNKSTRKITLMYASTSSCRIGPRSNVPVLRAATDWATQTLHQCIPLQIFCASWRHR